MTSQRAELRSRQHTVLEDLLAGRTPAAFDARGTAMTTLVLHQKRSSAAQAFAPELTELPGWPQIFHAWSAGTAPLECAHDDVAAFVSWWTAATPTPLDWLRLHQVHSGRRRLAWLRLHGHRVLAVGLGDRVWRFGRRRTQGG